MKIYSSYKELDLSQLISYSIRKRIDIKYRKLNKVSNSYDEPVSMGIHPYRCDCTSRYSDPRCKSTLNRTKYVIDYSGKEPVLIQECPNRFDDTKLWRNIYIVLEKIKDWDQVFSYYGIPVIQLPTHLYDFIDLVFQAKSRYLQQKEEKER